MTSVQRGIFIAALLLAAGGIGLGFVQAAMVGHATAPVQNFRTQWTAASQGATVDPVSYRNVRVIDAHTHIIKLASVLLLIGLMYPLIAISERAMRWLAVLFVAGSCLFPLGVVGEIYIDGLAPQAVAALGALLVLISFSVVLWGLSRNAKHSPLSS